MFFGKRRNKQLDTATGNVFSVRSDPVTGGYKYGDLILQVGGVSDETVKYGREFCGISTQE
jgi:hypothetical protein